MNRFEFYSRVETFNNFIQHYGIKGQKHGVRRWQNFDGTFNEEGKIRYFGKKTKKNPNGTVFISGSSKTQFDDSPYYRKELPKAIQNQINQYINQGKTILVGDAPGIDRQVQDYLNQNGYNNVEIYSPGKEVRYNANPKWKTNLVDVPGAEEGSGEWLAGKDKAMTDRADEGLAIVLDNGAQATRNNVARLEEQGKNCDVFQLNEDGNDKWNKHKLLNIIMDDLRYDDDLEQNGYVIEIEDPSDYSEIYNYFQNVNNKMNEIKYDDTEHKLKYPMETYNNKSGNCHDQTLFEKDVFKKMGFDPKAMFIMEVDPKTGQGGITHSFVYMNPEPDYKFNNKKQILYFENAWKDMKGIYVFDSINELKNFIKECHSGGLLGDSNKYPELVWGEFKGEPGDDLQEIVDKSLS